MTHDPIETRLLRYAPSSPPPELKDEMLDAVTRRAARRKTAGILAVTVGALILSGVLAQIAAISTYRGAVRLADGGSRPVPRSVMAAYAAMMGIHMPDAAAPQRKNGG